MQFKWMAKTPDQLKKQSDGLLKLAADVDDPKQAHRIRERAAFLLAKAEETTSEAPID